MLSLPKFGLLLNFKLFSKVNLLSCSSSFVIFCCCFLMCLSFSSMMSLSPCVKSRVTSGISFFGKDGRFRDFVRFEFVQVAS